MPGGPGLMGVVYFGAVKLAGYTAAAAWIKKQIPESNASPIAAGITRTVIGIGAGFFAAGIAEGLGLLGGPSPMGFYIMLAPIRICEWLLLMALFFRKPEWQWPRSVKFAILGTMWSFLLDIPAMIAVFVLPGGFWIC